MGSRSPVSGGSPTGSGEERGAKLRRAEKEDRGIILDQNSLKKNVHLPNSIHGSICFR